MNKSHGPMQRPVSDEVAIIYFYFSQQHEKEIRRKVESKLKEATHRRNDILSQKVHAAKKEGNVVCLFGRLAS